MSSLYARMSLLLASLALCSSSGVGVVEKSFEFAAPVSLDGTGKRWWPMRGFLKPHPTVVSDAETEDAGIYEQQLPDDNDREALHAERRDEKYPATPKRVKTASIKENTISGINNSTTKSETAGSANHTVSSTEETGSIDAKQLDSIEKVATHWAKVDKHGEVIPDENRGAEEHDATASKPLDQASTQIQAKAKSKSHQANATEVEVQQHDAESAQSAASLSKIANPEKSFDAKGSERKSNKTATIPDDQNEEKSRRIKELVARIARLQQNAPSDSELSKQVKRLEEVAARISDMQGDPAEGRQSRTDIKHLGEIAEKAMELEQQIAAKVDDSSSRSAGSTSGEPAATESENAVLAGQSGDAVADAMRLTTSEDAVITGESGDAAANALQAAAANDVETVVDGAVTDNSASEADDALTAVKRADTTAISAENHDAASIGESRDAEAGVEGEDAVTMSKNVDAEVAAADGENATTVGQHGHIVAVSEEVTAPVSKSTHIEVAAVEGEDAVPIGNSADTQTVAESNDTLTIAKSVDKQVSGADVEHDAIANEESVERKAVATDDRDAGTSRKRADTKAVAQGEAPVSIDVSADKKADATEDNDTVIADRQADTKAVTEEKDSVMADGIAHAKVDVTADEQIVSNGKGAKHVAQGRHAVSANESAADAAEGDDAVIKGKRADAKIDAIESEDSVTMAESAHTKVDVTEDNDAVITGQRADATDDNGAATIDESADTEIVAEGEDVESRIVQTGLTAAEAEDIAAAKEDQDAEPEARQGREAEAASKHHDADVAVEGEGIQTAGSTDIAADQLEDSTTDPQTDQQMTAGSASDIAEADEVHYIDQSSSAVVVNGFSETPGVQDSEHTESENISQAPVVPDFGHDNSTQAGGANELSSANSTIESAKEANVSGFEEKTYFASHTNTKHKKEAENHTKGSVPQEADAAEPQLKPRQTDGNGTVQDKEAPKDTFMPESDTRVPEGAVLTKEVTDIESVAKKASHLQSERDELATQLQKAVADNENMRELMEEAADKLELARDLKVELDSETAQNAEFKRELEASKLVIAQSHLDALAANASASSDAEVHPPLKYLGLKHIAPSGGTFATALFTRMTKALPVYFPGQGEFYRYYDQLTAIDRASDERDMFVVSLVRNPCDWYVSLWAHAAQYDAALLHDMFGSEDDPQPFFSEGNRNQTKFANWLRWAQGTWRGDDSSPDSNSVMSLRYWEAFVSKKPVEGLNQHGYNGLTLDKYNHYFDSSDIPRNAIEKELEELSPSSVADCWIEAEHYMEDTNECLSEYESASGAKLDWRPFTQALINKGSAGIPGKEPERDSCEYYYTPELAASVMHHDRHLFEAFGYDTCCGPRTKPMK